MASTKAAAQEDASARERILQTAEELFAEGGFNGVSMRDIAAKARVGLGQLTYYFESKRDLYLTVFLNSGVRITSERKRLLVEARAKYGSRPIPLKLLIRNFVMPYLDYARTDGATYVRLYARLHSEPPDLAEEVRRKLYDETTLDYADAFKQSLPNIPEEVVYWRLVFMMGTYNFAFITSGRLEVMSRGTQTSKNLDAVVTQVLPFIEAGLRAPVP
jgi:AcrR family transcriptional regulator